jgi:hypothetical protein
VGAAGEEVSDFLVAVRFSARACFEQREEQYVAADCHEQHRCDRQADQKRADSPRRHAHQRAAGRR